MLGVKTFTVARLILFSTFFWGWWGGLVEWCGQLLMVLSWRQRNARWQTSHFRCKCYVGYFHQWDLLLL